MSHQDFTCRHLKPLNWEVTGAIPVRPVVSAEAPSCSYFSKSRNNEPARRWSQRGGGASEEAGPGAGPSNAGLWDLRLRLLQVAEAGVMLQHSEKLKFPRIP